MNSEELSTGIMGRILVSQYQELVGSHPFLKIGSMNVQMRLQTIEAEMDASDQIGEPRRRIDLEAQNRMNLLTPQSRLGTTMSCKWTLSRRLVAVYTTGVELTVLD
jgi:hypothetical protein